jgi:hypothetical protein
LQGVDGPLDLSGVFGAVPLVILKALSFLEALTLTIGFDSRFRPVYEKSVKISDSVFFVVQQTEVFYVIPFLMNILIGKNALN